jgi:hypothetical protein
VFDIDFAPALQSYFSASPIKCVLMKPGKSVLFSLLRRHSFLGEAKNTASLSFLYEKSVLPNVFFKQL